MLSPPPSETVIGSVSPLRACSYCRHTLGLARLVTLASLPCGVMTLIDPSTPFRASLEACQVNAEPLLSPAPKHRQRLKRLDSPRLSFPTTPASRIDRCPVKGQRHLPRRHSPPAGFDYPLGGFIPIQPANHSFRFERSWDSLFRVLLPPVIGIAHRDLCSPVVIPSP